MRVNNISYLAIFILLSSCSFDIGTKIPEAIEYEELNFNSERGYYENKLYTGLVIARYPNGRKKLESTFVKGVDDGQFREWDEDGNLIEKANSKGGRLHGKYVRYYPSGQKHFETTYNEGEPKGEALEWHENGELKIKYYFKDGKENGSYTLWNDQGVKILEGKMKDGQRHEEWYEYNEIQDKVIINLYDQGELIKSEPQSK
jgi:antitoxin component YwqK of YwqJK toxin-antitoxin module